MGDHFTLRVARWCVPLEEDIDELNREYLLLKQRCEDLEHDSAKDNELMLLWANRLLKESERSRAHGCEIRSLEAIIREKNCILKESVDYTSELEIKLRESQSETKKANMPLKQMKKQAMEDANKIPILEQSNHDIRLTVYQQHEETSPIKRKIENWKEQSPS